MITAELNQRLTQTTPGSPMGELLRRYWWPVAAVQDLDAEPVLPVRLLSEDLTLFRDTSGKMGLIGDRCAHRAISLAYGIPQEHGLRCAYHGWTYDTEGRVVDMPFEPACLPLKIASYAVQELGGLVWAYLGPQETRPLLPRLELLVREDLKRDVLFRALPCNWLQCNDNSIDPVHFEHLHGYFADWWFRKNNLPAKRRTARHLKIEFDVFEYGIYKRRLVEGEPDDADDWVVGHPFLFPHTLVNGTGDTFTYQIRVPMDDTNTMHVRYRGSVLKSGELAPELDVSHPAVAYDGYGRVEWPDTAAQDEAAWIGQGPISDRTREHLVTSDKGIILYHRLLLENVEKVARGEDPMNTIRDEARNTPFIHVERERDTSKILQLR
jgi:5,5'-dehydrodivanillate O-demethylase